jgi:hypothetical protein
MITFDTLNAWFLDREQVIKLVGENWKEAAPRIFGIPIHPLGEVSIIEHILDGPKEMDAIRLRYIGVAIQLNIHTFSSIIFLYNAYRAIQQLCKQTHQLMAWCCIIQSLSGIIYTLLVLLPITFCDGLSCRQLFWCAAVNIVISSICVSITLLQKAYLVHGRNKKLLIIGILMMIPQPIIAYIGMTSPVISIPGSGCVVIYPNLLPWIKLAVEAPINIVFSIAFMDQKLGRN